MAYHLGLYPGRRGVAKALLSALILAAAGGQEASRGSSGSPFAVVAQQIVEEECPGLPVPVSTFLSFLQGHFFEAQSIYYSTEADGKLSALMAALAGIETLMNNLEAAYACPLQATRHFRLVAEWSLALDHPKRARCLMQMGNIFKIQAMARWWNQLPAGQTEGDMSKLKRYEARMQVEYTIAVTQLHGSLQAPLRPIVRFPHGMQAPRFEVHSICTYRSDPTSNTGSVCPLPQLSVPNHQAYAERYGYRYVLHTELPLPDREPHYSKMLVIHQAFLSAGAPDWVFFIDCDAFFTDAATSIPDILATYGAAGPTGPHFLVAEDPGGINTGTLLFRRSDWSLAFLERVADSQFGVAWDQSMFFWEILKPGLLQLADPASTLGARSMDFSLPPEVVLTHQAHLNAFVPPASRDWSAYEWQPGDFVRHFAGCPWQEAHCLGLMRETAAYAQQQMLQLSSAR